MVSGECRTTPVRKAVSLKNLILLFLCPTLICFSAGLVGFKGGEEMSYLQPLMMLEYVQKRLGQKAIVIDADDLQADPGGCGR